MPSALLRKDEKKGKKTESHLSLLVEFDVTKHVWIRKNMKTPQVPLTHNP